MPKEREIIDVLAGEMKHVWERLGKPVLKNNIFWPVYIKVACVADVI